MDRITRFVLAVAAMVLATIAFSCSDSGTTQDAVDSSAPRDTGSPLEDSGASDAGVGEDSYAVDDVGEADGGVDASEGDAGLDGGADVGFDSGEDAGWDAGLDGSIDAGSDAGTDAGADAGFDVGNCTPDPQAAADAPRTVLLAHPYGPNGSDCGRFVEVLKLGTDGKLTTTGTQLDVDPCPKRIVFSPDGRLVLIASYDDHVAPHPMSVKVFRHDAAGVLAYFQTITELDGTAPEDIVFSHDGKRAYVTDGDSQGGVHVLDVIPGCGAAYVTKIPMWVPSSLVVLPGDTFAVAFGGQDPVDAAVLDLVKNEVVQTYDIFGGFVDGPTTALSPDGKHILVPSGNPYSDVPNTLFVVVVDSSGAAPVPSTAQTLTGVNTPFGVLYSPDGTKALVTNVESDMATWYTVAQDGTLASGGTITGMSLADRMALLARGPNAGTVLVGALSDVHVLKFGASGVSKVMKLAGGSGYDAMTGDVAIEP